MATTSKASKVSFHPDTKTHDGTSVYNCMFEDMIVAYLSNPSNINNVISMIPDLLVLDHMHNLLENLIARIYYNKGNKTSIIASGGGKYYTLTFEYIPYLMEINKKFIEIKKIAEIEAFSPQVNAYIMKTMEKPNPDFNPDEVF